MCIDIIMKGKNNQTVIKLSVRIHEKFFLVKYLKSITHTAVLVKFKFYELKFEILCTRLVLVR